VLCLSRTKHFQWDSARAHAVTARRKDGAGDRCLWRLLALHPQCHASGLCVCVPLFLCLCVCVCVCVCCYSEVSRWGWGPMSLATCPPSSMTCVWSVCVCVFLSLSLSASLCACVLLQRGVKMGLGTDVSGGYSPSILNAMRLVSLSVSLYLSLHVPVRVDW
jgi:hypothetical protein